jgi:phage tail sheath protein FI
MARTYTTPGVYVEEIPTLPRSVAEVSTAIPAFLGYTAKGAGFPPTRIETMLEYEQTFGGPPDALESVAVKPFEGPSSVPAPIYDVGPVTPKADIPLLYYSLRLYFDNGGGPCYIVSVGGYVTNKVLTDFQSGLDALTKEDEPTLIVMPDATRLSTADFKTACQQALKHCGEMKNRFAILDVQQTVARQEQDVAAFKELASDQLNYGAAYTPYLRTALAFAYDEKKVTISGLATGQDLDAKAAFQATLGEINVTYEGPKSAQPKAEIVEGTPTGEIKIQVQDSPGPKLTITLNGQDRKAGEVMTAWESLSASDKKGFQLQAAKEDAKVSVTSEKPLDSQASTRQISGTLDALKISNTGLYNQVKAILAKQRVTLPPSGAVAGIYARVDRDRGVWKAPANVAVTSVIDLTRTFTDAQQGALNVDPTSGKSINVIRSFTGRGALVWGARTLAGNDNEWRYVPVRRLFITIEESTRKASAFSVFEPNDATTWLKVKAMIESYLYGLWERGALAGSRPEAAYFVNVGLGQTMTAEDVLEGRMIVEIGVAAVRPSEFIILRFTHQLQAA